MSVVAATPTVAAVAPRVAPPPVPGPRARSVAALVAIVALALGGAFALTIGLRQYIAVSPYVFFYAAVAICAAFAGVPGGVLATLAAIVVVDYYFVLPPGQFGYYRIEDIVPALAFVGVASIVTALAVWSRRTRRAAEAAAAQLAARQREGEALASELEMSYVELETAMHDVTDARNRALASEERLRLLDESSRVLASSLDYEVTIAAVAKLAVPSFADWCAVDVLDDGEIKRLALEHVDPEKVQWARDFGANNPLSIDAPTGVARVIRSGEPQVMASVTDDALVASARDDAHLTMLRKLGARSVIIVPMTARSQTVGALTLVRSRDAHRFDDAALAVARDLARRSAIAIDNARLYRAALVANEAKANFLATMSHELRTPLAAVIGYEELLAEGIAGSVNNAQRSQLERIKASAMHLLSLIDEILLFARVEAGREEVHVEAVAAKSVVGDAITFVAPTIKNRSEVKLTAESIDPDLVLHTDEGKLRQMLLNLIANAVKFTPRGAITVRACAREDFVDFDVQDTGLGISRANQRLIFDPFWQVAQNTTRAAGGSGLGLSVSRRLAELLGGSITVKSELGVGSTFRISLPRILKVAEPDQR